MYKCLSCGAKFSHLFILNGKKKDEVDECYLCKPTQCSGINFVLGKHKNRVSYKEDFQEQKIQDINKQKQIKDFEKKADDKLKKIIDLNAKKIGIL